MVVVEGATPATLVTGPITMIIIGILLNIVGLGVFCWALFTLASPCVPVFRRPDRGDLFISSWSRSVRRHRRWLRCGRFRTRGRAVRLLRRARSPVVRLLIGLLFAVPAARAGYDVTLALAHIGIPSEWWRESFAMLRRHHRREHRLGARVDPDRARSRDRALRSAQPSHRLGATTTGR